MAMARLAPPAPSTVSTITLDHVEGIQELERLTFDALEPYPDARIALAEALRGAGLGAGEKESTA